MSQPNDPTAVHPLSGNNPSPDNLSSPPPAAGVLHPVATMPAEDEIRALFMRGKNGAAWFYWIAALSLINTVLILSEGETSFALGLGITLITDTIASVQMKQPGNHAAILVVALIFDAVVLGIVVLCGWLSQKRVLPVFAIGMLLYLLDGLVCLMLGSIICIGIHAYALWSMWSGFIAYRKLNALQRRMQLASGVV
jgi:hypothetical protein